MNIRKSLYLSCLLAVSVSASADVIVGADQARSSEVALHANDGAEIDRFSAFEPTFRGGVRVAAGDVNSDGTPDIIVATGPGGGPHVRVFDGQTHETLLDFAPYEDFRGFTGGVYVAAGDVDGDGRAEIITAPGAGGGPHVRVFSGESGMLMSKFFAYNTSFSGGVRVAVGDVNGDGVAEIMTGPGMGGGGHVRVFDAYGTQLSELYPYGTGFQGGVFVAAGDISGDSFDDIIVTPDAGAGPRVRVFDLRSSAMVLEFTPYSPRFTGGVRVAAGDVTGDGVADIITAPGPGGGPHVKVFDGRGGRLALDILAGDPDSYSGVFVAGF